MNKEETYVIIRIVELLCIGAFLFGALWEGTIVMNLTTPQYFMLYGGVGAIITEVLARLFKKKIMVKGKK